MTNVLYKIVKHGEGWAYQVGETFSETYRTHDDAQAAAVIAAREHELAGNTVGISFEDLDGHWHEELSAGKDRPFTSVTE
jgi:Uncharacterized protein conserved in bacteria (DUF2188)